MALVAPTGSGKSLIEAGGLADGYWVAAPNLDICAGIARNVGLDTVDRKAYEAAGLFTYKRLHTVLSRGTLPPRGLILDEGHHTLCDTLQECLAMCPGVPVALVTATFFRGTPDETARLLSLVGNTVHHVLSLRQALDLGRIVLPTFDVLPLMDDEIVSLSGGEFNVRQSDQLAIDNMEALVKEIKTREWLGDRYRDPATVVLPGLESIKACATWMDAHDLPYVAVVADTSPKKRQEAFAETVACAKVLLQIRAVGEGTDLPLRVMYDAAPTMSPSLWQQRVGRLTRPGGASRYYTTCHNLLRHGYLWEGLIPKAQFRSAVDKWPDFKPSRRTVARAVGLTGFGRFQPEQVRTSDGSSVFLYALSDKYGTTDAAALLVPGEAQPRYYTRTNRKTGERRIFSPRPGVNVEYEVVQYGKWVVADKLPDLEECASFAAKPPSPNQKAWWEDCAGRYGLDPDTEDLTAKGFTLLPILFDTRTKL